MRLARLLLIKSFAEIVFVAALGLAYYFVNTPPVYRGWSEVVERGIAGWAVNRTDAHARVAVQLYVDERFMAEGVAELPRPDVVAAGRAGDERCGFHFVLHALPAGSHKARVYARHHTGRADRRTLIPIGPVWHLRVAPDGTVLTETPAADRPGEP